MKKQPHYLMALFPRRIKRVAAWAAVDAFIVIISYLIAFSVRSATASLHPLLDSLGFIFFVMLVDVASLYLFGAYYRIWTRTSGHGASIIVNAVTLATLIAAVVNVTVSGQRPLPLSVVLLGNGLAMVGFVGVRYRSRLVSGLSWRWKAVWRQEFPGGKKHAQVLIVGAGESGQTTAMRLKHRFRPEEKDRYRIIGFVDDDPDKQGMYVEGCPVLGTRADIPRLVEDYEIDLVIIAIHNITGPDFREVIAYCEASRAMIKVVPNMLDLVAAKRGVPLLRDVQPSDFLGRKPIGRHEEIDFAPITGCTVLVTGAAGSIGSELCRQLVMYEPVKLVALDSNESGLHDLFVDLQASLQARQQGEVDLVPALVDITQRDALRTVFETFRPEVVFHAAAYKHVPMLELYPNQAVRVNIGGTLNLANLAAEYDVERFVMVSTDKAVKPTSVMGATKRVCEMIMLTLAHRETNATLFTSVRFGNVLGSRGSVVPTFNRQIDQGGPVTVTDKEMQRYFMTISEAVNLVLHAACLTKGNDLFMLRMGELMRIVDLAERMIRMRGLRPYDDIPIRFTGKRPGEKIFEELQDNTEFALPTVHPNIVQLIKSQNGLKPSDFLQNVQEVLAEDLDNHRALPRLLSLIDSGKHEIELVEAPEF